MLFPTVTIGGVHYLDGGIVSRLNVPAARPADVVVVVSCQPLSGTDATEVDKLRGSARVVTVEPDFRGFDTPIRDPATTAQALPLGRRQAEAVAAAPPAPVDSRPLLRIFVQDVPRHPGRDASLGRTTR